MGKRMENQNAKQLLFLCALLIVMSVVLSVAVFTNPKICNPTQESGKVGREKIVTTICIEKNSTLWDIASEYYTEDYADVNDLIEEIKMSNGIKKDMVHEGAYIIVPHYVSCE